MDARHNPLAVMRFVCLFGRQLSCFGRGKVSQITRSLQRLLWSNVSWHSKKILGCQKMVNWHHQGEWVGKSGLDTTSHFLMFEERICHFQWLESQLKQEVDLPFSCQSIDIFDWGGKGALSSTWNSKDRSNQWTVSVKEKFFEGRSFLSSFGASTIVERSKIQAKWKGCGRNTEKLMKTFQIGDFRWVSSSFCQKSPKFLSKMCMKWCRAVMCVECDWNVQNARCAWWWQGQRSTLSVFPRTSKRSHQLNSSFNVHNPTKPLCFWCGEPKKTTIKMQGIDNTAALIVWSTGNEWLTISTETLLFTQMWNIFTFMCVLLYHWANQTNEQKWKSKNFMTCVFSSDSFEISHWWSFVLHCPCILFCAFGQWKIQKSLNHSMKCHFIHFFGFKMMNNWHCKCLVLDVHDIWNSDVSAETKKILLLIHTSALDLIVFCVWRIKTKQINNEEQGQQNKNQMKWQQWPECTKEEWQQKKETRHGYEDVQGWIQWKQ